MRILKKIVVQTLVKLPISLLDGFFYLTGKIHRGLRDRNLDFYVESVDDKKVEITRGVQTIENLKINLYTPNSLCLMRAETFYSKEPETIEWISKNGKNKILFDIGANIGLYSIFHVLKNSGYCYAFEPSFFNLKQLTKNININNCQESISVFSNPLSERTSFSSFINSNQVEGGALSAYGVDFGYDGKKISQEYKTNVLGFRLDDLFEYGFLKDKPNLIKIDVDGIEHLILEGARKTLMMEECETVLIEVNDNFKVQAERTFKILNECGFKLRHKTHAEIFDGNPNFGQTYNQIWFKEKS